MKTLKCAAAAFFLWAILFPAAAWPAVTFNSFSLNTNVRREGRAELIGTVTITVVAGGTIPSGSLSLNYSSSISPTSPVSAAIACKIGGSSVCPGSINVQVTDSSIILGFANTTVSAGDSFSFVQTRIDATKLPAGTTSVTALLTGTGGSGITVNNNSFIVGTLFTSIDTSTFFPASNPGQMISCSPPGLAAVSFGFTVKEAVSSAFTTQAQENALAPATNPTSGSTLEVTLLNVPAGVTITPTGYAGSVPASLVLSTPAPQTSMSSANPMVFSFAFTITDTSNIETAQVNFNAGFTTSIDLAAISGPIQAKIRLGPVSTANPPAVVSFADSTLASGTPFVILPCVLQALESNPVRLPSIVSGSGPTPGIGVSVTEVHGLSLPFTSTSATTTGQNWLSYSPTTGTVPMFLSVTGDATNLSAGNYTGSITVNSMGATSVTIPVLFTVLPSNPTINLSKGAFIFKTFLGQGNPATQTVNISNGGGGVLAWTATASTLNGGTWLSVSPASGTGAGTITAAVDITGLSAGQYNGMIQVAGTGAVNTPQSITVTLTVSAAPTITVLPAGPIAFTTSVGSNPPSQSFNITNTGSSGSLGLTITTATQSSANWLAATPANGATPLSLTVSAAAATLAAGNYQGTITLTAPADSGTSNNRLVIPVALSLGLPVITPGGIVGGAAYAAGLPVTPGSIASIFGTRLCTQTVSASGSLTTTLGGTQVLINGVAAPLFYVSPTQINFQMPFEATGSPVGVVVVSAGNSSPSVAVATNQAVPGIFTANGGGTGQAAALNSNNSANSASNPAAAGSIIQLYATGLGNVFPLVATGAPGNSAEPLNRTVVTPIVNINGVSAIIQYSGLAPGFVGLYQLNVVIPPGTPSGSATVQVIEPGSPSNTVTIAVK